MFPAASLSGRGSGGGYLGESWGVEEPEPVPSEPGNHPIGFQPSQDTPRHLAARANKGRQVRPWHHRHVAEENVGMLLENARDPAPRVLVLEPVHALHDRLEGEKRMLEKVERESRVAGRKRVQVLTGPQRNPTRGERHRLGGRGPAGDRHERRELTG